jgi:methylenetetrahydrofolate dehydrogenase (NADP+)/methenyltetrahydrofolate cyclohydrolase
VGRVIDGKAVAASVRAEVKAKVEFLRTTAGCVPGLATVLVGDDPASRVYVRTKQKACCEVGIASFSHQLEASTSEGELLGLIDTLNGRSDVHGILLQLPLPPGLSPQRVIERVLPHKDADGLHPYNQGRLLAGDTGLRPCTPLGVLRLIDSTGVELKGKCATVVGRSSLVGKPVALMLLERHATVTLCHSRTQDLADEVGRADVVVAALGRARAIKGAWIREGAIVIDVGISRLASGELSGDVEFDVAQKRAGFITPVPGGVGPMTVAMLLANTVQAAEAGIQGA